jgi:hypothetical protein
MSGIMNDALRPKGKTGFLEMSDQIPPLHVLPCFSLLSLFLSVAASHTRPLQVSKGVPFDRGALRQLFGAKS